MNSIKCVAFLFLLATMTGIYSVERTFAMIKPGAVAKNKTNEIIAMIKDEGFKIVAMKKIILEKWQVRQLYKEHRWQKWFTQYVHKMIASPAIVMVLERENAVDHWDMYKKMIRQFYGVTIRNSVVHGSDTLQDAQREMALFFSHLPK